MIARRAFITGLVSLIAAPAIVRAGSLMPVKAEPVLLGINYAAGPSVSVDVLYGAMTLDQYASLILRPMVDRTAEQMAKVMRDYAPSLHQYRVPTAAA